MSATTMQPRIAGAGTQLHALVAMRWTMVRSRRVRAGLLVLAGAVPLLVAVAVAGSRLVPADRAFKAAVLAPTAFLAYAMLAVLGPLAAGGGNELFPAEELVPHPIRPATVFVGSVVLTPLNIAWVGQTIGLLALSGYVAGSWSGLPSALGLTAAYAAAATLCGQAIAWGMVGLRQTRWGRGAVWLVGAGAVAVAVLSLRAGLTHVLDRAPTRPVVVALLQGASGLYSRWAWTLAALVVAACIGLAAGIATTAFALRRQPGAAAAKQARPQHRRPPRRTVLRELRSTDRASVWRAPALRRGVFVIGLLPGTAAALAKVEWPAVAITSGLVTAGAGLLFGVNAFCLDGGGSMWLASQPLRATDHLIAKAWVMAETCVACSSVTVIAAATRADMRWAAAPIATVVGCVVACGAVVVAAGLRSSVRRPHRADLNGPRDTPAPPGAMAAHSAQLATTTTFVALLVTGAGLSGRPAAPLLLSLAVLGCAVLSARRTARMFLNTAIRANVVMTVSAG